MGMLCKVIAMLMFAIMFAAVRWLGPHFPIGEIVFFRSLLGLPVIVLAASLSGGLHLLATKRVDAHALRSIAGVISMFCNFTAYTLLPLADVTAIGFAAPLFIVVLAAVFLRERVHIYRWSAVVIGFIGVLVIVGPEARMASGATIGVMFALTSAALAAVAMIFLRRMSAHEHSTAIAFYFMLTAAAVSIFTLPLGWDVPTGGEGWILLGCGLSGGVGPALPEPVVPLWRGVAAGAVRLHRDDLGGGARLFRVRRIADGECVAGGCDRHFGGAADPVARAPAEARARPRGVFGGAMIF